MHTMHTGIYSVDGHKCLQNIIFQMKNIISQHGIYYASVLLSDEMEVLIEQASFSRSDDECKAKVMRDIEQVVDTISRGICIEKAVESFRSRVPMMFVDCDAPIDICHAMMIRDILTGHADQWPEDMIAYIVDEPLNPVEYEVVRNSRVLMNKLAQDYNRAFRKTKSELAMKDIRRAFVKSVDDVEKTVADVMSRRKQMSPLVVLDWICRDDISTLSTIIHARMRDV